MKYKYVIVALYIRKIRRFLRQNNLKKTAITSLKLLLLKYYQRSIIDKIIIAMIIACIWLLAFILFACMGRAVDSVLALEVIPGTVAYTQDH